MMVALAAFATISTAKANDGKSIPVGQLPAKAQEFLKAHFPGIAAYATVEWDFIFRSYEVSLAGGTTMEFDNKGEWEVVDCRKEQVPAGIVPTRIAEFVNANHAGQAIVKIDRDRRDYEIELRDGTDIKFDLAFNVIGYDD